MSKQNEDSAKILLDCLIVIFGILVVLSMISCASTIYVPIETVRTEYRYQSDRDSIHVLDSVFIREKGDTVWLTRWRTEYRDRFKTDSIFVADSIQVAYPVERELTRWQQFKMDTGGIAIGGILAVVLSVIVWIVIKTRIK